MNPAAKTVFFDDFSGDALDRTKWNVVVTGQWVNNEQQAYVDAPEVIRIVHGAEAEGAANGALEIRAVYRSGFVTPNNRKFEFVSGRLDTRGKFEAAYGTWAARMKLPAGAGALGTVVKPLTLAETVVHIFPTSFLDAMARNDVLQIVCFAVLFAMAVIAAGEAGKPVLDFFGSLTQVMFKFAGVIMKLAPYGVGAAIAVTVGLTSHSAILWKQSRGRIEELLRSRFPAVSTVTVVTV